MQILLSLVLIYMVYLLGRSFLNDRALKLALILYTLDPLTNLYTLKIMPELLFTFVFMGGVLCYGFNNPNKKLSRIFVAGVSIGLSVYIRPISMYFFVLLMIFEILRTYKTGKKIFFLHAVLFWMAFTITVLPWCIRNHIQCHYFGMSTVGPCDLYFYKAAAVEAGALGNDYYTYRKAMENKENLFFEQKARDAEKGDTGKCMSFYTRESLKVFMKYPLMTLKIGIQGLVRLFLDPGSAEFMKFYNQYKEGSGLLGKLVTKGFFVSLYEIIQTNPLLFFITFLMLPYSLLVTSGSLFGVYTYNNNSEFKWGLVIIVIYFVLLSCGPETTARFRMPIMPYLCLLSSLVLVDGKNRVLK